MSTDFGEVYEDHVWDVYAFFAYRVSSRDDAEDLTQQTFERALRAWGRFDPSRALPRTWLLAIARNLLIDHYRADRSSSTDPLELDDVPRAGAVALAGPEETGVAPELERALRRLSQRDREVLAFRFGAQLTGPEIAVMLDLSVANVQQIVSRSLRRLRTLLEDAGEVEGTAVGWPREGERRR